MAFGNNGKFDWGSLIRGGGDFLTSMFQKNPADAANPFYNQVLNTLPQYTQPWRDAGTNALPSYIGNINKLLENPGELFKTIGANYKQSPGYQFQLEQGENAINNAAAAGGMAGTPQHQQQAGTLAENLANQDFYNYMGKILGLYGSGLQGIGDISKQGEEASENLGTSMSNILLSQAMMNYLGQQNQNSSMGGGIGSLIGGVLGAFGL